MHTSTANEFWDLYRKYGAHIYNYFLRYLGNKDDAGDLTGQVFINAQKNFTSLKDPGKVESWLWAIARNTARNFVRDRKETVGLQPGHAAPATAPDMENGHRIVRLKTALRKLSEEDREILLLREYHGFSYVELADILAATPSAVKSRLFRARQSLRKKYFEREQENEL